MWSWWVQKRSRTTPWLVARCVMREGTSEFWRRRRHSSRKKDESWNESVDWWQIDLNFVGILLCSPDLFLPPHIETHLPWQTHRTSRAVCIPLIVHRGVLASRYVRFFRPRPFSGLAQHCGVFRIMGHRLWLIACPIQTWSSPRYAKASQSSYSELHESLCLPHRLIFQLDGSPWGSNRGEARQNVLSNLSCASCACTSTTVFSALAIVAKTRG